MDTFIKCIEQQLAARIIIITVAIILNLLFLNNKQACADYPATLIAAGDCAYIVDNNNDYDSCSSNGSVCLCHWIGIEDYYREPLPPARYVCPDGGTLSGSTCISSCTSPRYPSGWQAWTDAPITAGTTSLKGVHVNELRTNINLMRTDAALGACSWTDPILPTTGIAIRKVHIDELRSCVSEVYTKCGKTAPLFTDPTITPGVTPAKAIHINELRTVTGNAP